MEDGSPSFPQCICTVVLRKSLENLPSFAYKAFTFYGQTFQTVLLPNKFSCWAPTTPTHAQHGKLQITKSPACISYAESIAGRQIPNHKQYLISKISNRKSLEIFLAIGSCLLTVGSCNGTSRATHGWVWALPLSLSATNGITIVFSSTPYLDVSVQTVPSTCLIGTPNNQLPITN
ncbi:MAG: hypothetical protein CH104c_0820 [Candidatus Woesebacteria bacterium]|nr:MAG: hypothetical protein CH104c_0820 [Candidatus Woesebacteria bacterium]